MTTTPRAVSPYDPAINESVGDDLQAATGTRDRGLQAELIQRVYDAVPLAGTTDATARADRKEAAVKLMTAIKPQDEVQGLLAAHVAVLGFAGLDAFRRAAAPGATLLAQDTALRQGGRLTKTMLEVLHALDQRQGKGATSISVNNTVNNFEAGAQTLVQVQTGALAGPESVPAGGAGGGPVDPVGPDPEAFEYVQDPDPEKPHKWHRRFKTPAPGGARERS